MARSADRTAKAATDAASPHARVLASCPVVGIGASVGGLDAFQSLFSEMPADSGVCFVLVPHLDGHHKSAINALLEPCTKMPIIEISERQPIEPNQIYVIAPNTTLQIAEGELRATTPHTRHVIDEFFQSLAVDQGANAIGIILSGTGSDGTLGLKAIKELGGLTFAQDGIPSSVAESGILDFILPVEQIPARLIEQVKLRESTSSSTFYRELRANLPRITTLLHAKLGHDFSQYKQSSCMRRIQRRMQVLQVTSVPAYVELLRRDANEADALFRDLLIGVTQFFRDPEAFEVLATQVIPAIFDGKAASDPLRVWVPGCSTGEEAYSIGIVIREEMLRRDLPLRVQIFATDIDRPALAIARAGLYPEAVMREVSAERLQRFFVRHGAAYGIAKDIREMCIFSLHDLTDDAPFSRLDLISCRNLLIYFDGELQSRVLALFHFALAERGYLFLGPSENVTPQAKLFTKVDSRARFFKARPQAAERFAPEPPITAARLVAQPPIAASPARTAESELPAMPSLRHDTVARRAQHVLELYAPAAVVIDEHDDVLHFSGRVGRYLQPNPGTATLNLFDIVAPSLRPDLRSAVKQASINHRRVVRQNLALPSDGSTLRVSIAVEPLPARQGEPPLYVIVFQELGQSKTESAVEQGSRIEHDEVVAHLEAELIATRERLQTIIEELETSNEELKASNEEFQVVNEELQSSNEELETSKEELQSVNEELETVNAELRSKLDSLDRLLSDRKNLLESMEIATIFLDSKLTIKSFTPAVTDIFHVIDTDIGRPLTDIVTRIAYPDLPREVERVLRTLSSSEHEVTLKDRSASYIMRILPYRTVDKVIDGVVITFVDITGCKRGEEAAAQLATIVANSPDAIIGLTPDGMINSWNAGASRMYGYSAEQAIGQSFSMLVPDHRRHEIAEMLDRLRHAASLSPIESERIAKDRRLLHVSSACGAIRNAASELVAAALIERDISERKAVEERQEVLLAELNHRVKNALATVLAVALRTRKAASSIDEFYTALEGRIRALAHTHDLLTETLWSGADLREIVRAELDPYSGKQETAVVDGPEMFVSSRAALVFGMVFHELATNSAKYGALSAPSGRIEVRWVHDGPERAQHLRLEWNEYAATPPSDAGHDGFGIKFIERSIVSELNGTAEIDLRPQGLHILIRAPLAHIEGDRSAGSSPLKPALG